MAALDRERDGSDVFARAMECGESLAQPPQRGKKTWESEQRPRTSMVEEMHVTPLPILSLGLSLPWETSSCRANEKLEESL